MNPFEMVIGIVLITSVAAVLKARWGVRHPGQGHDGGEVPAETRQLRDEVKTLKERIQVLERIATDRSTDLEHEIERLRDR